MKTIKLGCLLLDNKEIMFNGRSLGFFKDEEIEKFVTYEKKVETALLNLFIVLEQQQIGNHELLTILKEVEIHTQCGVTIEEDGEVWVIGVNHSIEVTEYCKSFILIE